MKCLDCDNMQCKTFYHKTERWEGYCRCLKRKVYGDNDCQYHAQLDLFDFMPERQSA